MAFLVVETKVLRKSPVDGSDLNRQTAYQLVLKCSIEPLQMSVVVGATHSGVSMIDPCPLREEARELAAVVALQHRYAEGCDCFELLEELERSACVGFVGRPRMRKPGTHINTGEYVDTLYSMHQMYGIQLHQIAWFFNIRTRYWRLVGLLPALLQQVLPVQGALH